MSTYVVRCPECSAEDVFPGGCPGGPALCEHPSSAYVFTQTRLGERVEALRERLGRSEWIVCAEALRVLDGSDAP